MGARPPRRARALLLATALALFVAACATPPAPPIAPTPAATESPPASPAAAAPGGALVSQPLRHLRGRNLKPLPEVAIDVSTKCNFHDVAGGRGSMDVAVTKAEVRRFTATIDIPKQGLCEFDLKNFRQTGRLPHVVLTAERGTCVVRMWQQGRSITVAFNACQAQCGGEAFSYLWPVLIDSKSGRCS